MPAADMSPLPGWDADGPTDELNAAPRCARVSGVGHWQPRCRRTARRETARSMRRRPSTQGLRDAPPPRTVSAATATLGVESEHLCRRLNTSAPLRNSDHQLLDGVQIARRAATPRRRRGADRSHAARCPRRASPRVSRPATSCLSRLARMLLAMPSSEPAGSSLKWRRLPNMMSRNTSIAQGSPSTSIAALTGNPDRGAAPSSQSL